MIRIAVCDDDERDLVKICDTLNNIAIKIDIDIKIFSYSGGAKLLEDKKEYDLIFLDIEMGKDEIDGIETAKQIRLYDMNVPIVYVTLYPDYWKRAYKVHAFDFVSKPCQFEDIENVIHDFIVSLKKKDEKKVNFDTNDGTIVLSMNFIRYLKLSSKRHVDIYTTYCNYISNENLNSIMEKLDKEQFFRTSRDHIVNLNFVSIFRNKQGITLKDGTWIPLSVNKETEFYEKLSQQLRQL